MSALETTFRSGAQRFNVEAAQLYPDLQMRFLLASIREQR
jgi:hypothetical protein